VCTKKGSQPGVLLHIDLKAYYVQQTRFAHLKMGENPYPSGIRPMGEISARLWTAATCRRFGTGRHVGQFQSADVSAHSKTLAHRSTTSGIMPFAGPNIF
jgi:hypothetical protein